MTKKTLNRFLSNTMIMPMFAILPLGNLAALPSMIQVPTIESTVEASAVTKQIEKDRQDKADKIDAFFASHDAPLEGYGMKFVEEAEDNDLDWRLLPAIAMRESTGGKQACKKATNSVFGYGSCKLNFKSIDESIEIVARSLGGNNPNTAHHYDGKTTMQILRKYNSVIPNYPKQVAKIMNMIDDTDEVI